MNSDSRREVSAGIAQRTRRKITRRLIPFLFVLYIVSYQYNLNGSVFDLATTLSKFLYLG